MMIKVKAPVNIQIKKHKLNNQEAYLIFMSTFLKKLIKKGKIKEQTVKNLRETSKQFMDVQNQQEFFK